MASPSPIVNFIVRGFQIVFAACVLGLSVGLIKGQRPGLDSPISLRYCAFVGGISFIAGFVGVAAEWVSVLQGKIGLIIDGVVTLINIAGAVLLAIQVGLPKCSDTSSENRGALAYNHLFNGGTWKSGKQEFCWNCSLDRYDQLNARCKECQADTVFMFFIVILLLVSLTMTFLRTKKGY
ncbi:hypothetical protein BU23DRAFT_531733 [Bimuria novae-zelandiae CBS 107.79]|uniref:MARVEL domain-containing protein n=1 Tax=Bimuria novae-zelandiae CBS 107.79 TaxID=1447943 RepID=A0A6A5VBR5_9PLEO|nr:hypothetical protein BU23DRAFT_531733 [Bimuria novae-zelandiae CBS 107.79]